ncbi:MAG TPA: efflux RND transporter periplasmic adaptor subunit [Cytophagaceae bacterium]|jgi:RND family efflux transporter MFP subunit
MKRIIPIALLVAVLAMIAIRLVSNKKEINSKNKLPDNASAQVSVNAALAQSKISETNVSLVGTLIPIKEIEIKSEVQGKIISLNYNLGDYVKKGQLLARIDADIMSIALSTAEQNVANAKRDLERYSNLYKGGAATEAQFQQYTLSYENAKNRLQQARKELSNTNVAAPISGFITKKPLEAGAFANIGTPLATVVDISELKVELNVAENDVYTLKVGDRVTLTSSVFPGINFEGKIVFISPRGDAAHNYPIQVSLQNQDKNTLKAGTYVNVIFNKKNAVPTLQIPREALVGSIKNAQVYTVQNNKAMLKKVTIGADNGPFLEVVEGLKEGETVVTSGQINLADNSNVTVINKF